MEIVPAVEEGIIHAPSSRGTLPMTPRLTRRHFLMSSAAGVVAASRLGAKDKVSPNEKLHIGVIGVAGQGHYNWGQLRGVPQAEVVALCDVHESRIGPA